MSKGLQEKPRRILLLADRQAEPDWIQDAKAHAIIKLGQVLPYGFEIVDSAAWHAESYDRCGDWTSWFWETVHGIAYQTRKRHFDAFLVAQTDLGRANAEILKIALSANRPVLFCKQGHDIGIVYRIEATDAENWKSGWSVEVTPLNHPGAAA